MAKFDENLAGSSLHVHTSLWSHCASRPSRCSHRGEALAGAPSLGTGVFRSFLGGLLAHAREITLLLAPNPNCYKRYRPGTFAPTGIAWSYDNRTAGFRIVGAGASLRVECRIPGADANPVPGVRGAAGRGTRRHRARAGSGPGVPGRRLRRARPAPRAALASRGGGGCSRSSDFARAAFGDDVVEHLLHFARTEQAQLDARVSDVERARYFERI